MDGFADRLLNRIKACRNAVCVGLDPRWDTLPSPLREGKDARQMTDVANAYEQFCCDIIDVVRDVVPVVKPQMAFFERLGPNGMAALANVIRHASRAGLLVVLDGKRNDIGSTAAAYAEAYLGSGERSAWGADALTVSPYLGEDSLEPFFARAQEHDAGLFVLVKTSNPGSGQLQDLLVDGQPIFEHVASWLNAANESHVGTLGYGPIGAVAGATHPDQLCRIRSLCPTSILLVPGFGAQGGTATEVSGAFDEQGLGAIVNSSRGIIFAHARAEYRERFAPRQWQDAVRAAADEMIAQLADGTPCGRL